MELQFLAQHITESGMRSNSFMEARDKSIKYWMEDEAFYEVSEESTVRMLKYNKLTNKYEYVDVVISDK